MSHARRRIPGVTYGVAIRCAGRHNFLVPTSFTNLILRFLLAFYALKHGIQLHGYAFLSNHYHLVLTDVGGVLGEFMRDFNSQVARILNARLGRGENLFSRDGYEAWELGSEDLVPHLAYVAANPVAAGLVSDPARWPGLLSLPEDFGAPGRRAVQPEAGFYGRGPSKRYPQQVRLELTLPPGIESPEAFLRDLRREVAVQVEAARSERPGQVYLPPSALARVDPQSAPPGGTRPDFQVRPHLARGASREWKAELKAWREAYSHALYAWKAGVRTVTFPPGTYLMRRLHRAKVAPLH